MCSFWGKTCSGFGELGKQTNGVNSPRGLKLTNSVNAELFKIWKSKLCWVERKLNSIFQLQSCFSGISTRTNARKYWNISRYEPPFWKSTNKNDPTGLHDFNIGESKIGLSFSKSTSFQLLIRNILTSGRNDFHFRLPKNTSTSNLKKMRHGWRSKY